MSLLNDKLIMEEQNGFVVKTTLILHIYILHISIFSYQNKNVFTNCINMTSYLLVFNSV